MDFELSEAQQDLRDLATQILDGELSTERLKEVDASSDHFDRELWARLAEAGLLGAPGDLYGPRGADHVRISLTAPDDKIALTIERLNAVSERR
jgi:alkylation response protein AidB-like acyl-CoA dehydrogenase